MKHFFVVCSMIIHMGTAMAQNSRIETAVYAISSDHVQKVIPMFSGAGSILSKQSLTLHALKHGKKFRFQTDTTGDELFFIIQDGPVEVQLNDRQYSLDKGSVVFVLPGDKVVFVNRRKDPASIYQMQMHATGKNIQRGKEAGASFAMDWNEMVFKPHDKGGVRQLFDRKTVMLNRFDIHITTLNPGLKSHDPHTHVNEEIILMMDGMGEMQLGNKKEKITNGGAAWVESLIPHNITNIGKRPATYFAIQWN
ncbi:MAG: hypothetical protein RLZ76_1007 [Bacteroidota bacterium]|jgi:(S)-ureidoglycine aminohydrolase